MPLLGAVQKMELQRLEGKGLLEDEWRLHCHQVINVHRTHSVPVVGDGVNDAIRDISQRLFTYHHGDKLYHACLRRDMDGLGMTDGGGIFLWAADMNYTWSHCIRSGLL